MLLHVNKKMHRFLYSPETLTDIVKCNLLPLFMQISFPSKLQKKKKKKKKKLSRIKQSFPYLKNSAIFQKVSALKIWLRVHWNGVFLFTDQKLKLFKRFCIWMEIAFCYNRWTYKKKFFFKYKSKMKYILTQCLHHRQDETQGQFFLLE